MTTLSVNLNKVAHLRNTRPLGIPSVARAARVCVAAGAHGITVHPRPDGRHIRAHDVEELAPLTAELGVEFNIEGNPFPDFMALVRRARPAQATLVPDDPAAVTSDHGWDVRAHAARLRPIIDELRAMGVRVSLFMDADDLDQIARARDVGADRVELYTEPYARAWGAPDQERVLARFAAAAERARSVGLGVNAGHDLNLDNLARFCSIPGLLEVSIGHALIADAVFLGLERTVKEYLARLGAGNGEQGAVGSGSTGGPPPMMTMR
jgi:pyridoxine 5-phosphate synthase